MTKFIKASEVITAIESLEKEVREEATRTKARMNATDMAGLLPARNMAALMQPTDAAGT